MRISFFNVGIFLGLCLFSYAISLTLGVDTAPRAVARMPDNPPTPTPSPTLTPSTPTFDIDSPESIHVVVNKLRPLPDGFIPNELVAPEVLLRSNKSDSHMKLTPKAARGLESMFKSAKESGHSLILMSGYRSEETQRRTYENYRRAVGVEKADITTARPGYSEHQTGLAADVAGISRTCALQTCFANTTESKWIADNAHFHGYIVRYPDGNKEIPGYSYEPWHLRYVGTDVAIRLYTEKLTMEEFFKLPPAPDYP